MTKETLKIAQRLNSNIERLSEMIDHIDMILKDRLVFKITLHTEDYRQQDIWHPGESPWLITPALRKFLESEKTLLTAHLQKLELELEEL